MTSSNSSDSNNTPATCDICGLRKSTVVRASGMGPMSNAVCSDCVDRNAEAIEAIALRWYLHRGLDCDLDEVTTFIDGRFVSGADAILPACQDMEKEFDADPSLRDLRKSESD